MSNCESGASIFQPVSCTVCCARNQETFQAEQQQVLRVGLETATYVHTDDTGARHQGHNGYCTVIGNAYFTYFSHHRAQEPSELFRGRCRVSLPLLCAQ